MKQWGRFVTRVSMVGCLCGPAGIAFSQDRTPTPTGGEERREAALEKTIEARLGQDKQLKGRGLDAEVTASEVTLTGTVQKQTDKSRAEQLARVRGVSSINNQIAVVGAESGVPGEVQGERPGPKDPSTTTPREALPPAEDRSLPPNLNTPPSSSGPTIPDDRRPARVDPRTTEIP